MEELIGGWTGMNVVVELPKDRPLGGPTNQTFVPITAILHVCQSERDKLM